MNPSKYDKMANNIVQHYTNSYEESRRLTDGFGQLERARTQELIKRFLPERPSVILDVGGASGVYSFFMAGLGHQVHLIDIVPKHIEQAQTTAKDGHVAKLASMSVGDARELAFGNESVDVVVMHGPLYHLTRREDRTQALAEAWRVLRPEGALLAFGITRYAGAVYGISKGLIYDDEYRRMIQTEVETGQRSNPPKGVHTLPQAYFHLPEELREELESVNFRCESVLGVVGPAWLVPELDAAWGDAHKRACLMEMARLMEREPVMGPRILAVGRK